MGVFASIRIVLANWFSKLKSGILCSSLQARFMISPTLSIRTSNKANIVLVHGFWADGSGWSKVIPTLQSQGHFVVAGQHAHTSLADDVAATRQLLAEVEGPTLLVGHSYGGFVVSEAATDAPGVVGLVYISAFILDEGETLLGSGSLPASAHHRARVCLD